MLRVGDEPIPGYKLQAFLGRGQFGQVWKSSAPGGGVAALKFLDLSGKQGWKEFRGIQRVKQIRHAHLMPITALWLLDEQGRCLDDTSIDGFLKHQATKQELANTLVPTDTVTEEPCWLVVAQLLGDGTLMDRMRKCQEQGHVGIPREELLGYMTEAAKGIDFLNSATHDLGAGLYAVQHCDIKPDNILLVGDSVLICDFGVAQILAGGEDQARSTGIVGSLAYMSPECAQRQPSSSSDQYSLAISFYELATGALPFVDQSQWAVLEAHRTGELDFSRVDEREREVLRRATTVEPADRYSSCGEMVQALRDAEAAPTEQPEKTRKSAFVLPLFLAATVAAMLLGAWISRRGATPGEGKPLEFSLQIVPSDAMVTVDGLEIELTDLGKGVFVADVNQPARIQVTRPPDFEPREVVVEPRNHLDDRTITIELQHSADFHARQAFRRLAAGAEDEAVDDYARAIQRDERFAKFPAPRVLLAQRKNTATQVAPVQRMEISRDGGWLVAATQDGWIRAWTVSDAESARMMELHRHEGPIQSLAVGREVVVSADHQGQVAVGAISEDGVETTELNVGVSVIELAVSHDDGWVLVSSDAGDGVVVTSYRLVDGKPAAPRGVARHERAISRIEVLPDNSAVLTASWDGTARKWPLTGAGTGELIGRLSEDVNCLAVTSSLVALAGEGHAEDVSGAADGTNQVLLASLTGRFRYALPDGHGDVIKVLTMDATDKWLASGSYDGSVRVWNLRDGGREATRVPLPTQHTVAINGLVFSPVDPWLFSGSDDGTVVLWDLPAKRNFVLDRQERAITALDVSPSGRWLFTAGADGSVRGHDLRKCRLIKNACQRNDVAPKPADAPADRIEA